MGKRVPKILSPFIAAVHFTITRLPFKMAHVVMAFIMGNGGPIFIKSSNIRRNIRNVFPELDEPAVEALKKKILANFGRHVAEILHTQSFRDGKHNLSIDYLTPEDATFDGEGPAIYVGAHVGSWELFPLVFTKKNKPLTIIYSANEHPILDNFLMDQRAENNATYVEKHKALKPCIQALGRGESVVLLIDQRVEQGVEVSFFGHPATISRFPAMLATKIDCPIVPFEVARIETGHLRVVFQEAIVPEGGKDKQAEAALTQRIADAVQASIVRNADTWFCTKLRWRTSDIEKINAQQAVSKLDLMADVVVSPADK